MHKIFNPKYHNKFIDSILFKLNNDSKPLVDVYITNFVKVTKPYGSNNITEIITQENIDKAVDLTSKFIN